MIASLDPRFGGPSVAALGTAAGVRRQGIENLFLLPSGPKQLALAKDALNLLADEDVVVRSFPLTPVGDVARRWGISLRFARWMFAHAREFDIVHVHAAWTFTTAIGLLAARLGDARTVLTTHESLTDFDAQASPWPKRLLKRVLRALFLSLFDLVVFSSPLERVDSDHRLASKTVVIPHAVRPLPDVERPSRPSHGVLRVGFLGRLHPKKNLEAVMDAVARVPQAVLHVAGDGPPNYRDVLHERAHRLGITERVVWSGFIDHAEKPQFLASVDVLAMPSSYECFGVSAVEALGAGVPVLVSRRTGVAGVVEQYGCGLVIDTGADAVEAALVRLSADPNLLAELAASGPVAARAEFSVDVHGERIAAEYRRILRTRPGRAPAPPRLEEQER